MQDLNCVFLSSPLSLNDNYFVVLVLPRVGIRQIRIFAGIYSMCPQHELQPKRRFEAGADPTTVDQERASVREKGGGAGQAPLVRSRGCGGPVILHTLVLFFWKQHWFFFFFFFEVTLFQLRGHQFTPSLASATLYRENWGRSVGSSGLYCFRFRLQQPEGSFPETSVMMGFLTHRGGEFQCASVWCTAGSPSGRDFSGNLRV